MIAVCILSFINSQKLPGATGGIQGEKGTLFGVPYVAGSWQDKLIEAFAGSHDFIGGKISGLYFYKGKIIAVDKNDNKKLIDLTDSDKQKLAAKETAVLMKEIAGIEPDGTPVVVSNQRAKEMTSSTTYDLSNPKDRTQLQGQTDMGYINTDEKNTRIYVQTGMQTTTEDALKNAQALSQIVKEPVGVIVNGTQGLHKDVEEYLPKAPTVKDALNEYTYQTLNKKGDNMVVLHSAGNEDAKKALQLGQKWGMSTTT